MSECDIETMISNKCLRASMRVHGKVVAHGLYRKQVHDIVNYPKILRYKDEKVFDPY